MAKQKKTSLQPSLFRREIPHMPEGYYSPGPNPNLSRFVDEHAKPYDPASDNYHVPPFDQPITTTKATAIYNMHTYWSKKPHDAIRQYIRHYTQPGDLVLDPFCGSGGTALAALTEGRAAIAIDLSPAATFITKNYCTPVDVDELQRAYDELQRKVKPEMDWLYETRCDRCDGRATTASTVYSYVFQCPRCLEKVPLFDCIEIDGEKDKKILICPSCNGRGIIEEIHTRLPRFECIPVLVSYLCEEGCKPQRGERRHNDPDLKKREYFQKYDQGKLAEIENKTIPHWYPLQRMMNIESDQGPWGDLWRPYHGDVRLVSQFYTHRNLWALAKLLEDIKLLSFTNDQSGLLFCFSSMCLFVSRMHQENANTGGNIAKGTYYFPPIFKDINVWDAYARKWSTIVNGLLLLSDGIKITDLLISSEDATKLHNIPNLTIDYIFTDPPYGGRVPYGELNFIWEAWFGFDTKWHDKEIIVSEIRKVSESDWAELIRQAFIESFRVLKPGRWLSLCFHDTSEGTWQSVQDLATEVGFIPDKSESTLFIDVTQKSWKQIVSEKVTKRDLVINFRKPRLEELAPSAILTGGEDAATFTEKARLILSESLEAHPGSTADRLYDELVSRMVRRGEFQRHNFDKLLRSVAEEVRLPKFSKTSEVLEGEVLEGEEVSQGEARWYLLETAGHIDEAESKKEAAAAKRLEEYMRAKLPKSSETRLPKSAEISEVWAEGVHYSDLFEQYLPIKDKPRRLLQDWLPEFFYKTSEGTWRLPANEEERQQKAALRSSGALRRIKRFANALLDGAPPHERDKPENAVTLADWIRQCRRAGLFELGRALYEKGGLRFEELSEETQLLVEEDYQICVGRSEKVEKGKRGKGKKQAEQPRLLQEDAA